MDFLFGALETCQIENTLATDQVDGNNEQAAA